MMPICSLFSTLWAAFMVLCSCTELSSRHRVVPSWTSGTRSLSSCWSMSGLNVSGENVPKRNFTHSCWCQLGATSWLYLQLLGLRLFWDVTSFLLCWEVSGFIGNVRQKMLSNILLSPFWIAQDLSFWNCWIIISLVCTGSLVMCRGISCPKSAMFCSFIMWMNFSLRWPSIKLWTQLQWNDSSHVRTSFKITETWKKWQEHLKIMQLNGQVQGMGWFLTWFLLKLAENNDVDVTVIWGLQMHTKKGIFCCTESVAMTPKSRDHMPTTSLWGVAAKWPTRANTYSEIGLEVTLRPLATSCMKDYKGLSLVQTSLTELPNTVIS